LTETITGTPATVQVGGDPDNPTPLLLLPEAVRDAVLVTNLTPGTVIFADATESITRQFPIRAGETVVLPFREGQVYAYAAATTADGEALDGADLEVRPVTLDSALERGLAMSNATLTSTILSRVGAASAASPGYAFDIILVPGTDYTVAIGNAFRVPFAQFDVSGMTLEPRKAGTTTVLEWLTLSLEDAGVAGRQTLVIEAEDAPVGVYLVDVVAVSGSVDRATLRGRIRVS
jgi:hypothetical protein